MILKIKSRLNFTRPLSTLLLLLAASLAVVAQEEGTSQYDKGTPPQHAAGISAFGSYMATDLGTVNLSNGSLNFRIPLGSVGGRGFSLPITLNYSSKIWSGSSTIDTVNDPTQTEYPASYAIYDDPDAPKDFYQVVGPGWTIGAMPTLHARGVGIDSHTNSTNSCTDYTSILVKLTLVLPDKGEIELRDDATDGSPMGALPGPNNCKTMDGNRGTRWHATDGSGIIFINDVANGVVNGNLNGWVITADGTRYRFNDTDTFFYNSAFIKDYVRASSITDRNGNQIQISYTNTNTAPYSSTIQFTDQLGRITKIQRNVVDPADGVTLLTVLVTLPGYDGATQGPVRYYKIKSGVMNANYRALINPVRPVINGDADGKATDYTWTEPHTSLFPHSYGGLGAVERIDDRTVMTELVLPDARSLKFKYNEFGEVAEVQMPTGARVQYDYAYDDELPSGNSLNVEVNKLVGDVRDIDRAVVQRRTYINATTTTQESTWTYNYGAQVAPNGVSYGCTEVKAMSGGAEGPVMLNERHFFLAPQRYINLTTGEGTGYSLWSTGVEWRTETRDAVGVVINASEQDWSQRAPLNWSTVYPQQQPSNDNRVNESRRILDNGKVAKVTTLYDQYNNPTEVKEFDFDATVQTRKTTTSYLNSNTTGGVAYNYQTDDAIHILRLPVQQSVYDGVNVEKARAVYAYDNYTADANNAAMVDYGVMTGHDAAYGVLKLTRGNVTRVGRWLNGTTPLTIYSYSRYDEVGNVVSIKDARGNVSTISYTDDYGNGASPGNGVSGTYGATYALPTLITSPAPVAGQPAHTARSQYNFSTGQLTGFKDRNGVVTQTIYDDEYNRPTQVKTGLGLGVETHSAMYYAPTTAFGVNLTNNDVLTVKDLNALDDGLLRSWTKTDGFGRTTEQWSEDPSGDVKVVTVYDALGRPRQTSYPFRPSSQTAAFITSVYDMAGRVTSVTTPDNAAVGTAYSGNLVTVTDQAGKDRQSTTDALGRLTQVIEDPGTGGLAYSTTYAYDVLDNLTTVTQGSQTRTFVYDSLERLILARNPEQSATLSDSRATGLWSISYTYDNNGNLTQKKDARSVTTTNTYDALNRLTLKNYSDTTPDVTYTYDATTVANSKGRLTSVSSSVSATNYTAYDPLGRVTTHQQVTGGQTYSMAYGYNRAGAMTSETYPSGRVVSTAYDGAGRISTVSGQKTGEANKTYASQFTYAAHGAVSSLQLGNGLNEHTVFNNRLQPQMIGLGTSATNSSTVELHYYYGGTDNNGNVQHHTSVVGGVARQQVYEYDQLNRLKKASEVNQSTGALHWQQAFTYDRYGNRNFDVANTTPAMLGSNLTINQTNNHYTASTILYDDAGNLTKDFEGHIYSYDAENKQISYDTGTASYSYDGDGRRVKKVTGIVTTIFVYDAGGKLVAEYSTSTPEAGSGTSYLTSDSSGTPRVITDSNGAVKSRHDYLPFGEEIAVNVGGRSSGQKYVYGMGDDGVRQKFTQKERDAETGLDYFLARYYSSAQGRFTSPDSYAGQTTNPQSFNRYAYTLNNPLKYTDPTGHSAQEPVQQINGCVVGAEGCSDGTGNLGISVTVAPEPDTMQLDVSVDPAVFATTLVVTATNPELALGAVVVAGAVAQTVGVAYVSTEIGEAIGDRIGKAIVGSPAQDDTKADPTTITAAPARPENEGAVPLYHASINNATQIRANGLDPSRGPTWVTRDPLAAANAISNSRYEVSQGLARDPGIITSMVPRTLFNQHFASSERPYSGFGGRISSSEIVLRTPVQFQIFNSFIVR